MKKEKTIWNNKVFTNIFLAIIFIALNLFILGILGVKEKDIQINIPQAQEIKQEALYKDFHLVIPILNLDAPIISDVSGNDKVEYYNALENGVAHFKDTKKPGEGSNIFIFGHSSFYWWSPGDFKDIFASLDQLKEGDEIILWFQEKEYKYQVINKKIILPEETSVLQPTQKEQVTLMTCYPVGTAQKRLIIVAKP